MPNDAGSRPPIKRITHRYSDWSLEWSLLSAILVGGAIGAVGVIVVVLWLGLGGAAPPDEAHPTAIVFTVTPSPIVPTATSTPPPTAMPTPEGLYIGGQAQVVGTEGVALRLRADPGLQTTTLKTIPEGASLLVLDGPREVDGLTWWRLRDLADGAEGWAAQRYLAPAAGP